MEDDCSLETVPYWNFTWKDVIAKPPYDWDVVQIAIICTGDIFTKIHKRFVNEFSTACYLITRHHAKKLVQLHCRKDKFKLDNGVRPRPVADDLIYNSGNTYAVPLLLYPLNWGPLSTLSTLTIPQRELYCSNELLGTDWCSAIHPGDYGL